MTIRRVAAIAIGAALFLCVGSARPGSGAARSRLDAKQGRIAVIAHRGACTMAPENTLAAMRKAIDMGADLVEMDVRTTADGHIVVIHDPSVDRITDGRGAVRSLTLAQIKELDAGSWFSPEFAGEKVPTLEETLSLCRGKVGVYIDLKDASVPELISAVEKCRMTSDVAVFADVAQLQEMKRLCPRIAITPAPGGWLSVRGIARFLARSLRAEVIDSDFSSWRPERIRETHAAGARAWVEMMGESDNAQGMREAIRMGADAIETDHPDILLRLLGRTAAEK
jgi:glycerophosphoryl diester phosphodiesterase